MRARRPVLEFVAVFAVAYAVLLLPALRLDAAHAAATRALWNATAVGCEIAGVVDVGTSARFEAGSDGESALHLRRASTGFDFRLAYRSRAVAFWPTALVVALALATPTSRTRRLRALVLAGALVQIAIGLSALAVVADAFGRYDAASGGTSLLSPLVDRVLVTPLFWILLPLGTWALVAFRRLDWGMAAPCAGPRAASVPALESPPRRHVVDGPRPRPVLTKELAS